MSELPTPAVWATAVVVLLVLAAGGFLLGFGGTNQTVGVSLANDDADPHDLDVRITFENSTLLDHSTTLDPDETRRVEFQNPATVGDATVTATLATGESTTATVRVGRAPVSV